MADEFRSRVLAAIRRLHPGEVVSYGDIAAEAGYPGAARAVGAVLAHTTAADGLAWWRVVMSTGHLAPGKERDQARRLRAEGVDVAGGRVVVHRRSGSPRERGPPPTRPGPGGREKPVDGPVPSRAG